MIAEAKGNSSPDDEPSLTAGNGRAAGGRFAPGNKFSKGNPYTKRINQLRSKLMEKFTDDRMELVAEALIAKAESGDLVAIRDLFDRLMGKVVNGPEFGAGDDDGPTVAMPRDVLIEMIRGAAYRNKQEPAA